MSASSGAWAGKGKPKEEKKEKMSKEEKKAARKAEKEKQAAFQKKQADRHSRVQEKVASLTYQAPEIAQETSFLFAHQRLKQEACSISLRNLRTKN